MSRIFIFAIFASLLLFGCMGLENGGNGGGTGAALLESPSPTLYKASYDSSAPVQNTQYVTKEGQITIKVAEGTLESSFEDLRSDLTSQGAQLSDIRYSEYGNRKQYSLTIKVEPAKFDSINAMIQKAGEVKDMSVQLEDVTKQYVELDLRIKNKDIELERLYKIYNKTDNVSDLLAVEREVARVETEIEVLKQQKQDLVSRVERSTITITIYEDKPASTQLTNPLENIGPLFFGAMAVAVTVVVGLSGFLIPILFVLALIWLAYKKLFGDRKGKYKEPEHKRIPMED